MTTPSPSRRWQAHVTAGSLRTLALISAGLVVVIALNLLLARTLDASDFGSYAFAIAWVEVLALLAPLGLDRLLTREEAIAAQRDAGEARTLARVSDWVTLAASLAGAGLAAAAMTLLRSSVDPALFPAFWIAMLIVPVRALIHVRNGALLGLDRPVTGTAPTTALYPTVLLLAVAVVAVLDPDALTAAWAVTLALGASALTLVWASAVTRRVHARPIAAVPTAPQLRTWLSAALPMMMITALGIVNLRADVIMVGAIVNAPAAGVYFIASQMAFGVRFGMIAATPALSSVAASLHDAGATAELQAAVKAAARVVFAIAAAAFVFLVLAGGQVLAFFGNEFRDGYQALMLLGTGTLIMMALGPVESVLMMTGHERRAALSGGLATLVNVGLNAALIPSFGIEGAAAATALSGVAWAVVLNRQVSRHLGIDAGVVAFR